MESPALYICPYCKITFNNRTEGWDNATQHIRKKHRRRGTGGNVSFSESVPRDNLFSNIGTSPRGFSL